MTKEQMQWASQHDWFMDCYLVAGLWVVITRGEAKGCNTFTNFTALRKWAGY